MKRAALAAALIAGSYFGIVLVLAGLHWTVVIAAFGGILAGAIAIYPLLEWAVEEQRHREERDAATAWISQDPYGFAKRIADVFADELDDADAKGDHLADTVLGASHLASALTEIARRAAIRRQEELLRSRTWLP